MPLADPGTSRGLKDMAETMYGATGTQGRPEAGVFNAPRPMFRNPPAEEGIEF